MMYVCVLPSWKMVWIISIGNDWYCKQFAWETICIYKIKWNKNGQQIFYPNRKDDYSIAEVVKLFDSEIKFVRDMTMRKCWLHCNDLSYSIHLMPTQQCIAADFIVFLTYGNLCTIVSKKFYLLEWFYCLGRNEFNSMFQLME